MATYNLFVVPIGLKSGDDWGDFSIPAFPSVVRKGPLGWRRERLQSK
ncbi:MAG TPA: hypothetical protein VLL52_12875 [Anaerolineae bacterium]|nr:hypothetical protein [Anaerolineae bacterium]